MAARKPGPSRGIKLTEEHRDKIRKSKILEYLVAHIEGGRDMSQTQVMAAIALLRKIMPDLSATTLQGDDEGGPVKVKVVLSFD